MRNTLRAPADATAANGTNRVRVVFAVGDRRLSRGTIALSPRATEQEAETAKRYDLTIVGVDRGVDLLALALLIPTLRDWLVICQSSVPVVWESVREVLVVDWIILYLKTWCEHASGYYEIGDDEAGHAKGKEYGLAGV